MSEEVYYEIDFNHHLQVKIKVKNNEIKVVAAMDGYGNSIDLKAIKILTKQVKQTR